MTLKKHIAQIVETNIDMIEDALENDVYSSYSYDVYETLLTLNLITTFEYDELMKL